MQHYQKTPTRKTKIQPHLIKKEIRKKRKGTEAQNFPLGYCFNSNINVSLWLDKMAR